MRDLSPIINGTGTYSIEEQTRDHKRMEVVIHYLGRRYIIEMKICRKSGAEKGSEETISRRIYLHIYFNKFRQTDDKIALDDDLYELKTLLESGIPVDELSPAAQKKTRKYFTVKKWGSKINVTANNKAIKDANKYHGYFALVSNKEKDPSECLCKYRKRETIESFFEAEKQYADGTRARVWYTDTLRGRMFVQFISLCYYEYFSE